MFQHCGKHSLDPLTKYFSKSIALSFMFLTTFMHDRICIAYLSSTLESLLMVFIISIAIIILSVQMKCTLWYLVMSHKSTCMSSDVILFSLRGVCYESQCKVYMLESLLLIVY